MSFGLTSLIENNMRTKTKTVDVKMKIIFTDNIFICYIHPLKITNKVKKIV